MKHMKKLFGLLLAVVMVFAMSVSVFADTATKYTITINNTQTGHTYEAYQIFSGTLTETIGSDGVKTKKLTDIAWGNGVNADGQTALRNAEEKANALQDSTVADFAKQVAAYLQKPTLSKEINGKYEIADLEPGYYLVKDKDNTLKDADDFYTAYIMQVVGEDVQATPKGSKPTLDKEIKHNETGEWGVVGDNQIGDKVEFRTITTVPSDLTDYTKYDYKIVDMMSTGLTSNVQSVDDIVIKVNDDDKKVLEKKYYTVTVASENTNKFTVKIDILAAINDGKMQKGDKLYTYYSGILNKNASVYDDGKQDNEAYLIYSNNPNNSEDTTETPKKKVYDWTFKMGVNKVKENGDLLTGAKFVLSKVETLKVNADEDGNPTVTANLIALIENADGTYTVAPAGYTGTTTYVIEAGSTTIKGLDDAINYYLYETKAPSGYNKLNAPVKFNINAETTSYGTDGSTEPKVTVTIDNNEPSNDLIAKVINREGSSLPSTGGIGTTIFYVVGGILMAVAAILLITKKKMSNK
ncbi:SpaH/EbpB family LPXTG-anchored major pilin [Fusicatenibacter saccharivorans]|uniref:SpaH/EbpB family LPXTG-anchored major pilin n=1 Tax=Fusicatenibacter saccharivorans TaxID=1150298 RepID=UPI003F91BAA9